MSVGIMISGDGCTEPCEFAVYGFGHAFRLPKTLVRLRKFLRTIPPFKGQRLAALIYKELARAKGARSKRHHSPTPARSESKTRAEGLLRQFMSVFCVDECGGDIDQAAARLGRNPDTVERECEAGREWLRKLVARLPAEVGGKRSTVKGEARAKIIGALTLHHKYQDGSSLNLEPIRGNELARKASVGKSSVSRFFKKQFGGYDKYRAACRDTAILVPSLQLLNDEFAPRHFLGRTAPTEGRDDDAE